MAIKYPINPALGAQVNTFPKTQFLKVVEIIDAVNRLSTSINTASIVATTSVKTPVILPGTPGTGTSIQAPVITGTAYASPTVLTISQSGAILLASAIAGNVFTLPAATAENIGIMFTLIQTATVTSNFSTVQGATSADLFVAGSSISQTKGTATPTVAYYSPNGSSNYQYKTNGTTTGGIIGDMVEFICIGLNQWLVNGKQSASGTVATPFA